MPLPSRKVLSRATQVRLSDELHDALKMFATARGITISAALRELATDQLVEISDVFAHLADTGASTDA